MVCQWGTVIGGFQRMFSQLCGRKSSCATESHLLQKYFDDTYVRRKKNEADELYIALNFFYNNIRLKIEKNLKKYLDSHTSRNINDTNAFKVVYKQAKLPTKWSSAISKLYNQNIWNIRENLFRSSRIGSDFKHELELMKEIQTGRFFI